MMPAPFEIDSLFRTVDVSFAATASGIPDDGRPNCTSAGSFVSLTGRHRTAVTVAEMPLATQQSALAHSAVDR